MAPARGSNRHSRRGRAAAASAAVALGLGLLACGGGQTRSHPLERSWDDETGAELAALAEQWRPRPAPRAPDLVVGVVDRDTVVGRALPAGPAWTLRHPTTSRPVIAGHVVLVAGGGKLLGLDGPTGELLWERPAVGALRGAADDGELTVVSLESLSGQRSTLLAVDRAGVVVRQIDVPAQIGVPAVADGVGFLPWNAELVVVFDLRAGTELARVVSSSRVSHAWRVDGELFLGETTLLHFDPGIVAARFGASSELRLPARALPGEPVWLRPGAAPSPLGAAADDFAQMIARPVVLEAARPSGDPPADRTEPPLRASTGDDESGLDEPTRSGARLGFANGIVLARIHRAAVGLDAVTGATRWVRVAEHPWLGGSAARDGFCLCDSIGAVECLKAQDGRRAWRAELGVPLVACSVQVDEMGGAQRGRNPAPGGRDPAPGGRDAAPDGRDPAPGGRDAAPDGLVAQLGAALRVRDQALLALQSELLADLAGLDGYPATRELIAVASGELVPSTLRAEARAWVAERRTGLDAMLEALTAEAERPCLGSFVAPVTELGRALGRARHTAAAPIVAALASCAPLGESAVALAEALEQLARPDELGAVAAIAARHGCGPGERARERVVLAMARTALRLGDARIVRAIAREPCVEPALRAEAARMLEPSGR